MVALHALNHSVSGLCGVGGAAAVVSAHSGGKGGVVVGAGGMFRSLIGPAIAPNRVRICGNVLVLQDLWKNSPSSF